MQAGGRRWARRLGRPEQLSVFVFFGLSADQRLFWSFSPKRNAACLNVLIKMTLVPAGVVLTIEVSARFRSDRSYPDSVGQYNDPLSCSSPQVSSLSDADKNSDLREPLHSHRNGSSPLLRRSRRHSTCHHDVGAGEQLDLHGLAAAADHAGGHSESGRPERSRAGHG